jgi:hypothetical protein
LQRLAGLLLHVLLEGARQVELHDDRPEVHVLLAGLAEDFADDADGPHAGRGVLRQLDDDLGARLDVL